MKPEDIDIHFDDEPVYVPSSPRLLVGRWWAGLDATERVLYRGLALLAAGIAPVVWPLALIVPGAVLTGLAVLHAVPRRVSDG